MKRMRYLAASIIALSAIAGITACVDEYEYEPVAADNDGIYVDADKAEFALTEDEAGVIVLKVMRHDTSHAKTYSLECTDAEVVKVPPTVSFEAGEKEKTITMPFDLPVGSLEKKVTISPSKGDAYAYGVQAVTYSLSRCRTFKAEAKIVAKIKWLKSKVEGVSENKTLTVCDMGEKTVADLREHTYIVRDMYTDGIDIKFTVNERDKVTEPMQLAYYADKEDGTDEKQPMYLSATGLYDKKKATVMLTTTFIFGDKFCNFSDETITFPSTHVPFPEPK